MSTMTLKQLVASDLNLDKDVVCKVVSGSIMQIDLGKFKSKFIHGFLSIFKEHERCLTYSDTHIDMSLDMADEQDQQISKAGYTNPWENLQQMFNEPAPWDTIIPEGREEEFLDLFIEDMLKEVKKKNGL